MGTMLRERLQTKPTSFMEFFDVLRDVSKADPSELAELASSRRDGETSLLKFLSSSNTAPMRRSMRDGPPADMVRQVYTFARKVARHLAVDGRTAAHALSILGAITPPRLLANALLQNDEVDAESHMAVTGALAPALEALMPFAADACTAAAGSFKARPVAVMAGAFTFVRRRCAEHFAPAADQAMIALLSHGLPASAFATMREMGANIRKAFKNVVRPFAAYPDAVAGANSDSPYIEVYKRTVGEVTEDASDKLVFRLMARACGELPFTKCCEAIRVMADFVNSGGVQEAAGILAEENWVHSLVERESEALWGAAVPILEAAAKANVLLASAAWAVAHALATWPESEYAGPLARTLRTAATSDVPAPVVRCPAQQADADEGDLPAWSLEEGDPESTAFLRALLSTAGGDQEGEGGGTAALATLPHRQAEALSALLFAHAGCALPRATSGAAALRDMAPSLAVRARDRPGPRAIEVVRSLRCLPEMRTPLAAWAAACPADTAQWRSVRRSCLRVDPGSDTPAQAFASACGDAAAVLAASGGGGGGESLPPARALHLLCLLVDSGLALAASHSDAAVAACSAAERKHHVAHAVVAAICAAADAGDAASAAALLPVLTRWQSLLRTALLSFADAARLWGVARAHSGVREAAIHWFARARLPTLTLEEGNDEQVEEGKEEEGEEGKEKEEEGLEEEDDDTQSGLPPLPSLEALPTDLPHARPQAAAAAAVGLAPREGGAPVLAVPAFSQRGLRAVLRRLLCQCPAAEVDSSLLACVLGVMEVVNTQAGTLEPWVAADGSRRLRLRRWPLEGAAALWLWATRVPAADTAWEIIRVLARWYALHAGSAALAGDVGAVIGSAANAPTLCCCRALAVVRAALVLGALGPSRGGEPAIGAASTGPSAVSVRVCPSPALMDTLRAELSAAIGTAPVWVRREGFLLEAAVPAQATLGSVATAVATRLTHLLVRATSDALTGGVLDKPSLRKRLSDVLAACLLQPDTEESASARSADSGPRPSRDAIHTLTVGACALRVGRRGDAPLTLRLHEPRAVDSAPPAGAGPTAQSLGADLAHSSAWASTLLAALGRRDAAVQRGAWLTALALPPLDDVLARLQDPDAQWLDDLCGSRVAPRPKRRRAQRGRSPQAGGEGGGYPLVAALVMRTARALMHQAAAAGGGGGTGGGAEEEEEEMGSVPCWKRVDIAGWRRTFVASGHLDRLLAWLQRRAGPDVFEASGGERPPSSPAERPSAADLARAVQHAASAATSGHTAAANGSAAEEGRARSGGGARKRPRPATGVPRGGGGGSAWPWRVAEREAVLLVAQQAQQAHAASLPAPLRDCPALQPASFSMEAQREGPLSLATALRGEVDLRPSAAETAPDPPRGPVRQMSDEGTRGVADALDIADAVETMTAAAAKGARGEGDVALVRGALHAAMVQLLGAPGDVEGVASAMTRATAAEVVAEVEHGQCGAAQEMHAAFLTVVAAATRCPARHHLAAATLQLAQRLVAAVGRMALRKAGEGGRPGASTSGTATERGRSLHPLSCASLAAASVLRSCGHAAGGGAGARALAEDGALEAETVAWLQRVHPPWAATYEALVLSAQGADAGEAEAAAAELFADVSRWAGEAVREGVVSPAALSRAGGDEVWRQAGPQAWRADGVGAGDVDVMPALSAAGTTPGSVVGVASLVVPVEAIVRLLRACLPLLSPTPPAEGVDRQLKHEAPPQAKRARSNGSASGGGHSSTPATAETSSTSGPGGGSRKRARVPSENGSRAASAHDPSIGDTARGLLDGVLIVPGCTLDLDSIPLSEDAAGSDTAAADLLAPRTGSAATDGRDGGANGMVARACEQVTTGAVDALQAAGWLGTRPSAAAALHEMTERCRPVGPGREQEVPGVDYFPSAVALRGWSSRTATGAEAFANHLRRQPGPATGPGRSRAAGMPRHSRLAPFAVVEACGDLELGTSRAAALAEALAALEEAPEAGAQRSRPQAPGLAPPTAAAAWAPEFEVLEPGSLGALRRQAWRVVSMAGGRDRAVLAYLLHRVSGALGEVKVDRLSSTGAGTAAGVVAAAGAKTGRRKVSAASRFWKHHPLRGLGAVWERRGLSNCGNTCYLNAQLQQLHGLPVVRNAMLLLAPASEVEGDASLGALGRSLRDLFLDMACSGLTSVDTRPLVEHLAVNARDFTLSESVWSQNDGSEALARLKELFTRLLRAAVKALPGAEEEEEQQQQPGRPSALARAAQQVFEGRQVRHLRSLESEHASAVEEDMSSLPVPIERGGSLQAVLDRAFAPFIMEGANRWQPAGCGRPLRARTHVRIRTPPPVLVMELKRFAFDVRSAARVKVGTRFEFPWALDLGPYLSKADDEAGEAGAALYALRGVVLHSGTASSGHYISLVRCDAGEAEVAGSAGADALHASLSSPRGPASEKQDWPPGHVVYGSGARGPAARTLAEAEELARAAAWREANDSVVRPLSPEEVMAQSVGGGEGRRCAYLLYYDRVDGAAEAAPPALGCGLLPDAARLLDPASEAERACAASLGAAVESVRAANQAHRWERLACDADGMDATAEAVLRLSETQLAEPAPSRLMRASRALWGQQRFAAAEAADVIQAAAAGGGGASDADGKGGAAILGAAGRMSAVVGDSVRKWFVGDGAQTAAAAAGDQGCAAEGAEALLTEASARDEASLAAAAARVMTWWLGHVACCRAGEAAARVARRLHAPGSGLRLRPLHAAGLQEVELAGWAQPGADVGAAPSAFGASVVEAGSRACARVPPWRAHLMVEACCRAARAGDPAWLASTLGGDGQTGQWLARFVTCDGAPFSATDAGMAVWGPHARAWSRVLLTAVTAAACHAPVRDLWRVLRARCPAPAAAAHEAAAAVRAEWVGAGVAACAHPVPELVAAVRARHQRVPASCVSVVRAVWKAAHEAAKVGTAGAARVVALASALAAVDAGCRNEGADEAYAALHRLHESWGSVIGAEGHARAGVRALLWTTGSALTVAQEHTIMERLCGRAQGAPVPWSQVPAPLVPRCGLELVSTRAPLGSTAPQLGHALPPAGAHDASALAMLQGMLGCAMACARSEARGKRVVRTLVDEVGRGRDMAFSAAGLAFLGTLLALGDAHAPARMQEALNNPGAVQRLAEEAIVLAGQGGGLASSSVEALRKLREGARGGTSGTQAADAEAIAAVLQQAVARA